AVMGAGEEAVTVYDRHGLHALELGDEFGVSTQREEICRRRLNVHSVRFHDSTFQRLTLSRSHSMLHPKQLLARSSSGCLVGWCSKSGTSTGRSFFRQVFA
ncbi:hypothetical protein, partial [Streptomyces sp. NPDC018347]|uniref:hypothetical protein n=1 Tax=Streptomyces sp. NPDC018347 TaxID=3157193 RepID=UPI003410AFE0